MIFFFCFCIIFYIIWNLFLTNFFSKVPFVPLNSFLMKESIKLLKIKDGDSFVDIGSGNGKVVFHVAKNYPVKISKGIELEMWLVLWSKFLRFFSIGKERIVFEKKDALKSNYSDFNKVYMYLMPQFIQSIMEILEKDLPRGAIVVSAVFKIPDVYKRSGKIVIKKIEFRGKMKTIYIWKKF